MTYRTSKIVVELLLAWVGIVAVIARRTPGEPSSEGRHGWLTLPVGVVLLSAAVARSWRASRTMDFGDAVDDAAAVHD